MRRQLAALFSLAILANSLPFVAGAHAQVPDELLAGRETEPVVLTGASFAEWAAPADAALEAPGVNGKRCEVGKRGGQTIPVLGPPLFGSQNCTHNTYEDPDLSSSDATNLARTGVPVEQLLGYSWDGTSWKQIPFQVDEMAVRYLSNNNSGFAFYSETDQHTTYVWDREAFRWTENDPSDPCVAIEPTPAVTADPVPGLDTDDELVFMARDADQQAGDSIPLPPGIESSFEVAVTDPITQATEYVYVMKAGEGGPAPAYNASNGYVRYERDPNADVFLFSESSFENYGAAAAGPYYDPETDTCITDKPLQRRPGDQATITTPRYKFRYEGRWLMTELRVNNGDDGKAIAPSAGTEYGPDLVDQWKARAFQQRPGGEVPCCGYEEEVNNWGGSSMLMGERYGPVRTIRETWGADSGTNVVRREIFYRDEIRFGAFLRVHVIPPADGIYAQWDYNAGVVDRYYNSVLTAQGRVDGVAVDGKDDEAFGNSRMHIGSDGVRVENLHSGQPTPIVVGSPGDRCPSLGGDACVNNDIDLPDATFSGVNAGLNWEEVAGPNGSLVTRTAIKQITPGGTPQTVFAVPYYRDNACFDDGTGNDPGIHMDARSPDGDEPSDSTYINENGEELPRECWDIDKVATGEHPAVPGGTQRFYQGSIGTHGVHLLTLAESDNAGTTAPITEIDSEQRVVVLQQDPGNVGELYGRHSEKPLVVTTESESRTQSGPTASPTPEPSESSTDNNSKLPSNEGCDPLDPAACLLPFPNNLFTTSAEGTDTGLRIDFSPLAMPRNGTEFTEGGEGKPIDPTEWNRNDGFSPGSMVMTLVPGLDLHKTWGTEDRPHSGTDGAEPVINEPGYFDHRDHIADIGLYTREDAPLVILNTQTGERHPFWSELDSHPDAVESGERLLIMRPAVNFDEGTRYIVALRNLRTSDGSLLEPRSEFEAYKSGAGADADRQAHFNSEIFPELNDAGIIKDDLYLAWDFTVASEDNIAGRILHMRDDAFGRILLDENLADRLVDGNSPAFVVDSTENRTDTWTDSRGVEHSQAIRRVRGRVDVPNYMDRIQQTEGHFRESGKIGGELYYDVPAPGSRLLDVNRDGEPEQNPLEPTVRVPFVCDVPLNGQRNIPGFYGHGLLGDRDQINDFNRSPRRHGPFMGCAVDWWGMSTADAPTVVSILTDFSNFPSLPDRAQQGFLNFMIAGRAAVHQDGFAKDPAFQQDGNSLIKTADEEDTYLVYDGNSQGGIMGGALVALSPDISRGILGVLGMNYSTLLNRSVDWEGELQLEPDLPPYSVPFYESYRDPVERQIVFDLMQMLWDRGEANGFAHHMTDDPYPNTPAHEVMLQAAFSDHQVANVSAEVEARTIGAPLMTPNLEPGDHWALDKFIDTATYPYRGSALIYWDSGNATPPNGNLPPSHDGDPHGHPRNEPAAGWQEAHFLLTGVMYDVCQGGFYFTNRPLNNAVNKPRCLEPSFSADQTDDDADGIPGGDDNCPEHANPGQEDTDGDGIGNECDPTPDGDPTPTPSGSGTGEPSPDPTEEATPSPTDEPSEEPTSTPTDEPTEDPSPTPGEEPSESPSPDPTPTSPDSDGDGVSDSADNCPNDPNPNQQNTYGDARGDACEPNPGSGGSGGSSPTPTPDPTTTSAGEEPGDIQTTLASGNSKVRFGDPFTLSGTVDSSRDCGSELQVDIGRRVHGSDTFRTIATMDVADDLTWTFTGLARASASYIATARSTATCEGHASAPSDVLVKAIISARAPRTCSGLITGRVIPKASGSQISLDKRVGGEWKKIDNDRVNRRSRFSLDPSGCGRYRLVWQSQDPSILGAQRRMTLRR